LVLERESKKDSTHKFWLYLMSEKQIHG
jgi:hypothetical protein